jgi:hypothetical protein
VIQGFVSLVGAKTRLQPINILRDTGASQTVKVKCKAHTFFQMYTFLDSDFHSLIENRNYFQFAEDVCSKSSGVMTNVHPPNHFEHKKRIWYD